jgi:nitrate/nitrite transporter NarK
MRRDPLGKWRDHNRAGKGEVMENEQKPVQWRMHNGWLDIEPSKTSGRIVLQVQHMIGAIGGLGGITINMLGNFSVTVNAAHPQILLTSLLSCPQVSIISRLLDGDDGS